MVVSGGKVQGKYRATEKDEWQTLGQCDVPTKGEPRIGMMTGYAPKNPEHLSRFIGFRVVQTAN